MRCGICAALTLPATPSRRCRRIWPSWNIGASWTRAEIRCRSGRRSLAGPGAWRGFLWAPTKPRSSGRRGPLGEAGNPGFGGKPAARTAAGPQRPLTAAGAELERGETGAGGREPRMDFRTVPRQTLNRSAPAGSTARGFVAKQALPGRSASFLPSFSFCGDRSATRPGSPASQPAAPFQRSASARAPRTGERFGSANRQEALGLLAGFPARSASLETTGRKETLRSQRLNARAVALRPWRPNRGIEVCLPERSASVEME